jgi:hypothetical protein
MTAELKEKIRELTAAGESQQEIGRALKISRGSVYRAQKALGVSLPKLGPRKKEMDLTAGKKAEVLALLRSGTMSPRQIVDKLKVPHRAVRLLAEQHAIHRKKGNVPWMDRVSPELREKVLEEIRARSNYGTDIAQKFSVPPSVVYELARAEHGVAQFRPGAAKEGPFTSNFPLRDKILYA